MPDETVHTLVASSNRGRYALDDPQAGQDITSGSALAILLAGLWIPGRIEHGGALYASERGGQPESGYYFLASVGGSCGLCAGMKVKLL